MTDGNTYAINKYLDEREDFDALQEVTAELEQAEADNIMLIGRIEELEELLKAAIDDAKEAEAYAEQLENVLIRKKAKLSKSEALLAKAVELALTKAVVNLRTYAPCLVDGPEHDVGYYHGYHTALNRILGTIAELSSTTKGQGDE